MTMSTHASRPDALRRHAARTCAALVVLTCGSGMSSCVRVQISYRDVGTDAPDAPRPDAPRPDAAMDAPAPDAPGLDAPPMDTPRLDGAVVGADATRAVLASIGEHVILADLRTFESLAMALEGATRAAVATGTPEARDAARTAWRDAMRVWQRVEAVQVGPAGLSTVTAGGRRLRDEIDAWPLLGFCLIDRQIVAPTHSDAALLRAVAVNARGLSTLEYLLFSENTGNRCGAMAEINATGAWAALGDAEIARRRLVYAHTAAVLVVERAAELRAIWEPSGGNFLGELSAAGAGSSVYPTAQAALNSVSDSLVYLDKNVADSKIGVPAGLRMECPTDTCPDYVESPFADASLDHVRVNIEAFRDVYLGAPAGTDAPGFDDLLRSIGAGDLDQRIQVAIGVAFAALEAVEAPLESAVLVDHADVVVLFGACRTLFDLAFGVEALTLLDLQPSVVREGDSD